MSFLLTRQLCRPRQALPTLCALPRLRRRRERGTSSPAASTLAGRLLITRCSLPIQQMVLSSTSRSCSRRGRTERRCRAAAAPLAFTASISTTLFSRLMLTLPYVAAAIGAAYGTAKSGIGISGLGQFRPDLIMKSLIPVVMSGAVYPVRHPLPLVTRIANSCHTSVSERNHRRLRSRCLGSDCWYALAKPGLLALCRLHPPGCGPRVWHDRPGSRLCDRHRRRLGGCCMAH